jgi:transcriptional regulator with XRE-family HTH domain
MGRKRTPQTLKDAVSRAFRELLKRQPKLTQAEIARALNVSRQTVSQYLSGRSAPSTATLAVAMNRWDLEIDVGGHSFGRGAFPLSKSKVSIRQMELPLSDLRSGSRTITIPGSNLSLRISAKTDRAIEVVLDVKRAS